MPVRLAQLLMEQIYGIDERIKERFADESLCQRCGRCCHSGIRIQGRMILLPHLPCKHLTYLADGRAFCRIYEHREKIYWCNRINVQSIQKSLFPKDCPYVRDIPGYKGKIELSPEEFKEIIPTLREVFSGIERPEYIRKKDWDHFLIDVLGLKEPEK